MKKRLLMVGAFACLLTGCKIHYDQAIACPTFLAHSVAIWKYDADTYIVRQKDGTTALVSDAGCVVTSE